MRMDNAHGYLKKRKWTAMTRLGGSKVDEIAGDLGICEKTIPSRRSLERSKERDT